MKTHLPINPLKMADWLALYKSDAYAVQTEHLGKLIGFFLPKLAWSIRWCISGPKSLTIAWRVGRAWRRTNAG